jgi:hypothetical protein
MRAWKRLVAWLKRDALNISASADHAVTGIGTAAKSMSSPPKAEAPRAPIPTSPKPTGEPSAPTVAVVTTTTPTPSVQTAKPLGATADPLTSTEQGTDSSAKSQHCHQRKSKRKAKRNRQAKKAPAKSPQDKPLNAELPIEQKPELDPINSLLFAPDRPWNSFLVSNVRTPTQANIKGKNFEETVACILNDLRIMNPDTVTVKAHPKIILK